MHSIGLSVPTGITVKIFIARSDRKYKATNIVITNRFFVKSFFVSPSHPKIKVPGALFLLI